MFSFIESYLLYYNKWCSKIITTYWLYSVVVLKNKSFLVEADAIEIGVTILFALTELDECYRWIRNKVKKVETAPKSTEMKITGISEVLLICLIIYNIIVIGR